MIKKLFMTCIFYSCMMQVAVASDRVIALTIDDLPFVGEARHFHLNKIINTLTKKSVPAIGFVIASEVRKSDYPVLNRFREAGLELGNHSVTHANANTMPLANYLAEIENSDAQLSTVMTIPKYYRFPYLAEGRGENKKTIANLLKSKGYQVAPVTIDSKDYKYNQILMAVPEWERRKFLAQLTPIYLDYIWKQTLRAEKSIAKNKPQILLIHANLLTAYSLPAIITMYQSRGYRFVSLQEALSGGRLQNGQNMSAIQEWPYLGAASWAARYEAMIEHPPKLDEVHVDDPSWVTPRQDLLAKKQESKGIDRLIQNAFAWDE